MLAFTDLLRESKKGAWYSPGYHSKTYIPEIETKKITEKLYK